MNLIEVGDTIRIFNKEEILAYIEAGGKCTLSLEDCDPAWDYVDIVEAINDGELRTQECWYVPEELAEVL